MRNFPYKSNRRFSIRTIVILTVGIVLVLFMINLVCIVSGGMFKMLTQNETEQMEIKKDVAENAIKETMESTRMFAHDWSSNDETYNFAIGKNTRYMAKYWGENWKLQNQKYNFVFVKDLDGSDLYSKYYDYFSSEEASIPEGFSEFLSSLSEESLQKFYFSSTWPKGQDGFVNYNGTIYYICANPILTFDEKSEPKGVLLFGRVFDNREINRIIKLSNMSFTIIDGTDPEILQLNHDFNSEPSLILNTDKLNQLYIMLPSFSLDSGVIILKGEKNRDLHIGGLNIIKLLLTSLVVSIIICAIAVFYLLERYVIRPIERLGKNVREIDSSYNLTVEGHDSIKELHTLKSAINGMLNRLRQSQEEVMQSTVSISMMQSILDSLEACLFVADFQTDEVLFVNKKMKERFAIEENILGKKCRMAVSTCSENNCELCAKPKLQKDPNQIVCWEEYHKSTGRYYRKTDRIIKWVNERMAHIHCLIDITEIKQTGELLEKRLRRQEAMASISQSFIINDDIDIFMNSALESIIGIMNADMLVLMEYDRKKRMLLTRREVNSHRRLNMGFNKESFLYKELHKSNFLAVVIDDVSVSEYEEAKALGVKSALLVPIYVMGDLWGILELDKCHSHTWASDDVYTASLIGNMLSGVLTKEKAEDQMSVIYDFFRIIRNPIFELDTDMRFVKAYSEDFIFAGYDIPQLLNKKLSSFMVEDNISSFKHTLDDAVEKRIPVKGFRCHVKHKEGRLLDYELDIIPIYDVYGACIAYRASFDDISENMNNERQLIKATEAAEKASRAKGEFLSRMSHEMRTPMSAIIGMTDIAIHSSDPAKKEYCLEKIDTTSKHLLKVINDILDMSKIEANKMELSIKEFDVGAMIENTMNVISFQIHQKNQKFIVNIDKNVPACVLGDEARLSQVITNLLANASKFTQDGGEIRLNVRKVDTQGDKCRLLVEVIDTGIGIPLEKQPVLFNSFEQGDGSIARKYGGTGLGLAISKRIVELMGGSIQVESDVGKGSRFFFTINVKECQLPSSMKLSANISEENARALYVDDSLEARDYFVHLMNKLGLPCDIAEGGIQALDMIEKNKASPYNLFFIDLLMPGMTGIELTEKIRQIVGDNAVIVLISVAEWHDVEKEAVKAGVNSYVSKPIFQSKLINCINEYFGLNEKRQNKSNSKLRDFKDYTILLADDVDVNREIVSSFLDETGVSIDFANNGLEAVNLFKSRQDKYDLILLDIHMPEMNGYEAASIVRSLGSTASKNIPIIAMTANVFKEDVEKCLAAGMNDHIGKPVNVDELMMKLDKYLSSKNKKIKGNDTTYKPIKFDVTDKKSSTLDYDELLPAINVREGISRHKDNKALYFTLLHNFKGKQIVDEISQCIKQNSFAKVEKAAHALMGISEKLGFTDLADIARNIGMQAKMKVSSELLISTLDEAIEEVIYGIGVLLEREGIDER